uniref:Uncharacterized protein n=1 Tax=Siphoviridae sp. ctsTb19 TaxID=2827958 RepID=A0A8S5STI0_9CAUD|nr:MAG TPA: hypothetical protein [Siphoviridae sp. ctsTb19]
MGIVQVVSSLHLLKMAIHHLEYPSDHLLQNLVASDFPCSNGPQSYLVFPKAENFQLQLQSHRHVVLVDYHNYEFGCDQLQQPKRPFLTNLQSFQLADAT